MTSFPLNSVVYPATKNAWKIYDRSVVRRKPWTDAWPRLGWTSLPTWQRPAPKYRLLLPSALPRSTVLDWTLRFATWLFWDLRIPSRLDSFRLTVLLIILFLQGIYRVSGVKSRVENLCQQFETDASHVDLSDHHPNVVSNVLKLYLRQVSTVYYFRVLHSSPKQREIGGADSFECL